MKAIGFRVEPGAVHFAVVSGTQDAPVLEDLQAVSAPEIYDEAQSLHWYRDRFDSVMDAVQPARAAVKFQETSGRQSLTTSAQQRMRIEGVLLELLASRKVPVVTGPYASVSSRLGSGNAKDYIQKGDVRGLSLGKGSPAKKEAILVAVSALERPDGNSH